MTNHNNYEFDEFDTDNYEEYECDELTKYLIKNGAVEENNRKERIKEYRQWVIEPSKSKCLCCNDTGIVPGNVVRTVNPNYDSRKDKKVLCQNCSEALNLIELLTNEEIDKIYDYNFPIKICEDYHKDIKERQSNLEYLKEQSEKATVFFNKGINNIFG